VTFKKGHKHSEETKRKMSIAKSGANHPMFGRIQSDYQKNQASKASKGITWEMRYGKEEADKRKAKLSMLNDSDEAREKLKGPKSDSSNMGRKKGSKLSEKSKKKMSDSKKKIWKEGRMILSSRCSNTKPELKIQGLLNELGIEFATHQYMGILHDYQVDIFVPSLNLIIECDGNHWHYIPRDKYKSDDVNWRCKKMAQQQWDIDDIRTNELIKKGYKVLRLAEDAIKIMDIAEFKQQLII